MDEMKIFGLISYKKNNERDYIIKGLKVEIRKRCKSEDFDPLHRIQYK